ncbi:Gfo/Idh/MocA family protein [Pacificibacter marinus]|uniref:Inositol 2-dehydrogenase n=1 Tax=Pacificibacter marinus TaxID=658057 RepID=A0A1Y5RCH9_9RHOB|nr:Gfo/Idh/MocA family oxidoreductase [Pacificibacter marinus]SEK28009.1 myo-inositol 2-dehydrogenase / D-chiro-inositol 1-dehydrogenase [Pacificibacter marinus]SLN11484.1 Inositol 2-dehydrogenase [Pacificibacter marinus]
MTDTPKMLNIGWIGCGRHATWMLLPQIGRAGMRIAALCDRDETALKATAGHYGVTQTYTDWRDMLEQPGLDAVCMAVGPDVHFAATLAALEKGLPVFMEKPPAATHAQALELQHASDRTGVPVYVGFMKRYSTGNRIAHNILQGSEFGPVLGITGSYMTAPSYFTGEVDYTGFYLHHCVHYMDLMPWLAGSPIAEMTVRSTVPAAGKILFHMGFTCENGVIGNVVMGTVQSRGTPMEQITVMGDHNRIEVDNVINVAWHRDPPFKAEDPEATLSSDNDTLVWQPNFTAAANEDHKGYAALMADVAKGLAGQPTAAPRIADGVTAMATLERMIANIEEK